MSSTFIIRDGVTGRELQVRVTAAGTFLHIHPEGYDNPVSLDYYDGRLRLLVNPYESVDEPEIIDLEFARIPSPSC